MCEKMGRSMIISRSQEGHRPRQQRQGGIHIDGQKSPRFKFFRSIKLGRCSKIVDFDLLPSDDVDLASAGWREWVGVDPRAAARDPDLLERDELKGWSQKH